MHKLTVAAGAVLSHPSTSVGNEQGLTINVNGPLIVTGSVMFNEVQKSGMVSRPTSVANPPT